MNTVIYDADCALCTRVRETVEALDWLETMRWIPNRSAEAAQYGVPREMLDHSVYLVGAKGAKSGYAAVQGIVERLPLVWIVGAWVIARKPWAAILFAFLLSPLAMPVGQPAYEWVARNRHRVPGSTCDNRSR
jgi:predicted DCC family thiol-disulfide oxidoreductase YuxK